jgi:hypothetical protein
MMTVIIATILGGAITAIRFWPMRRRDHEPRADRLRLPPASNFRAAVFEHGATLVDGRCSRCAARVFVVRDLGRSSERLVCCCPGAL